MAQATQAEIQAALAAANQAANQAKTLLASQNASPAAVVPPSPTLGNVEPAVGSTRVFGGQNQVFGADMNWHVDTSVNSNSLAAGQAPGLSSLVNTTGNTYVPPPGTLTSYDTNLALTPQEVKAQDLTTRLQDLNAQLEGKANYAASLQNSPDYQNLTQTQKDLSARLKALQNEALAIPLQFQQYGPQSGTAQTFVNQRQTDALRTNAIASLGVSAQLEAANGNLALANDLIDRAVKAKYDPIQEQINTAKANLDLIINSPEYTLAEKNRAQQQKNAQDAKQAALDKQKQEQTNIYNVSIEAAKNGADAVTLQKIQAATTAADAIKAAGTFLQAPADTTITEVNGRKLLVNSKTGATIKDLGPATSQASGVSQATIDYYKQQISSNQMSLLDIPDATTRNAVANALGQPVPLDLGGISFNGLTATFKDGSNLTFPSQQALDQFKKDNNISSTSPASSGATGSSSTTQNSGIEAAIQNMKRTPGITDADVRVTLKKQGWSQDAIDNSSVGGLYQKALTFFGLR